MNTKYVTKISKFLSLVLRHKPERIGLALDQYGWVQVEDLIARAQKAGIDIDRQLLQIVVEQNNKKRFAFNEDGTKIRANQGHSLSVDLGLTAVDPPDVLYHGTATRFLDSIKKEGLLPQGRHHVHLSPDEKTAMAVGKRHGKPVVLIVKAKEMVEQGYQFYRSANGVWLTERVPAIYLLDG